MTYLCLWVVEEHTSRAQHQQSEEDECDITTKIALVGIDDIRNCCCQVSIRFKGPQYDDLPKLQMDPDKPFIAVPIDWVTPLREDVGISDIRE